MKLPEPCPLSAKVEQRMALVDAFETQLAASRSAVTNHLSAIVVELTAH